MKVVIAPDVTVTQAGVLRFSGPEVFARLDYGELVIRVRYVSDRTLEWEQVNGPQAGLKGQEDYALSAVRPGVRFFWRQEKDTSIVTQVVDFREKRVHTTWSSPEKKLAAFQGRIGAAR